jgi:hypothetical protein
VGCASLTAAVGAACGRQRGVPSLRERMKNIVQMSKVFGGREEAGGCAMNELPEI